MTRDSSGRRPPRADGGRPTPGVPDVSEDATGTGDEGEPDTANKNQSTTASGRAMPGVPHTEGATSQPPEQESGGSCGTESHQDDEQEHDLTTAISLAALKRTESPSAVVAEANTWSDWVGVVGAVSGPALNNYFRQNNVDVDFFNDVRGDPADMMRAIDEGHHFYSERRVLVGLPDEKEWAEAAGWEFQPFEKTAERAGWTLKED